MSADRWQRVKELFHAALERKPKERSAFLDEVCGNDQKLRSEVENLIVGDSRARKFMEPLISMEVHAQDMGEDLVDTRIGGYIIKRAISTGGMGIVYEARQEHPRRTVAIKVMKPGILSKKALRRFEYEAQILASLRHPGIAQLFEVGTYEKHLPDFGEEKTSVPFLVMEYIPDARPLTEYAREKHLTIRDRLSLFQQVCDAVRHGHQKGVIHRDLKPANLLVDPEGQVKIIDFGVARVTDSDIALTTQQTDVNQLIGTVQYMSPEQCMADPHDLDIRSDVYSLGVVLYELLCENLPYDVSKVMVFDATRIIREDPPRRPSTTNRTLRGDVETIILKAMEKERKRRYQTAEELRRDIDRYLTGRPITARPPSALYQLSTFARRNRAIVTGLAATFIVLVVGLIFSTTYYYRAAREAERSSRINDFFSEMLASLDPIQFPWALEPDLEAGETLKFKDSVTGEESLVEILLQKIPDIDVIFAGNQELEARARETIGTTLIGLGQLRAAEDQLRVALEIHCDLHGVNDPITNRTRIRLINMLKFGQGLHDDTTYEALALARKEYERLRLVFGEDDPNTLACASLLANVLHQIRCFDESNKLYAHILNHQLGGSQRYIRNTLSTMQGWVASLWMQRRMIEAEKALKEFYAFSLNEVGPNDYFTIYFESWKSYFLIRHGRFDDAEQLAKEAFERSRIVLGEDHFQTHISRTFYAFSLLNEKDLSKKVMLYQKSVKGLRKTLGVRNGYTAYMTFDFINFLLDYGDWNVAKEQICQWIEIELQLFREGNFISSLPIQLLNILLQKLGDQDLHRDFLTTTIELGKENIEKYTILAELSLLNFGWIQLNLAPVERKDSRLAIEYFNKAVEMIDSDDHYYHNLLSNLAEAYFSNGDHHKALETLQIAITAARADGRRSLAWLLERQQSKFLFQMGEDEQAVRILNEMTCDCQNMLGKETTYFALCLSDDVTMLLQEGRFQMAEARARECIEIYKGAFSKEYPPEETIDVAFAKCLLGSSLIGQGEFDEAEGLMLEGYKVFDGNPATHAQRRMALNGIIRLYEAWGKEDQAEAWREKL